jgi:hypothetical protein
VTSGNAPGEEAASTAVPLTAKTTGDDRDAAWTLACGSQSFLCSRKTAKGPGRNLDIAPFASLNQIRCYHPGPPAANDRKRPLGPPFFLPGGVCADGSSHQFAPELLQAALCHVVEAWEELTYATGNERRRKHVLVWTLKLVDAAGGDTAWRLVESAD